MHLSVFSSTPFVVLLFAAASCSSSSSTPTTSPTQGNPTQTTSTTSPTTTQPTPTTSGATPDITPLAEDFQQGFCFAHNWQDRGTKGYGSPESMASKRELKALGAEWVSITPFGSMRSLTSTEVRLSPNHPAGENDARLEAEVAQIRELGMKSMLKPHIWINFSDWRGHIRPAGGADGWTAWFASYTEFILHYARLAERLRVDAFVIGVELASSSRSKQAEWTTLIEEVRKVYSGPLTYAANWNEAQAVEFWDKLDWIGVQFFAPLTDKMDPTYEDLVAGMEHHLKDYQKLHEDFQKPVIFTEIGYKSIRATAVSPGTWPEHLPESAKEYDETNQALAFRAAFNTIAQKPWMKGAHVWKWFTNVETDEEGELGFSPRGKDAAKVISTSFAGE